jgi:dienelactone hydrolase
MAHPGYSLDAWFLDQSLGTVRQPCNANFAQRCPRAKPIETATLTVESAARDGTRRRRSNQGGSDVRIWRTTRLMLSGLAAAALMVLLVQAAGAQAARIELHSIQTLTLSDQQFLTGDGNAPPATLGGELRIAQGSGRLPVVVLMHGSGGVGPNVDFWANELNGIGISTFVIDGFTGRGLVAVNTDQARLGRLNFILDIYRSLDILAKHPRVDPGRIVLMGFSRGGQAALYASLERFHRTWNKSGVEFAAYIPFYPDCATTFIADTEVAQRPIRIFQGTPDDYNPVAKCRSYVERLREAGRDVQLTEYPNAQHGFDNPLGPVPSAVVAGGQTVRHCVISEEPIGVLINASTRERFSYKDPCVELNPHVGYDAAAAAAAKASVEDFLRKLFKLAS